MLYVAASVEEAGHAVEVVDLASGGTLSGHNPDLIGLSACTPHVPLIAKLLPEIRALYPRVPVILGGPHFTHCPDDATRLGADAVCVGDGEVSILRALAGRRGILRELIDIDTGPLPARHLVDIHRYHYTIDGLPATSMIASRGCPYHCAYCCRGYGYDTVRYHALDLVARELDAIAKLGFDAVMLYDDELNLSMRRLRGLCEVLKGAGLKWRGFIRSNLFTSEQARVMHDSGCVEVCCGVESGSDAVLARCDKRATVADATVARTLAHHHGLRFKAFMMIGMPGETEETVAETRSWLLANKPDDFDLCPFTPYPGSDVSANPAKYGIIVDRTYWDDLYYHKGKPGEYHVSSHTEALSAERIVELRDSIEREVREAL